MARVSIRVYFSQDDMDHVVSMGANKIRKSAAFGEIIIMTVYVPLFTLVGIEGKNVQTDGK